MPMVSSAFIEEGSTTYDQIKAVTLLIHMAITPVVNLFIIRSISCCSLNRSFILSRFKLNTLSELKIICPVCEKSTELITLKFLEINDVPKEELDVLENSDDLVMPEMSKPMYNLLCTTIKPDLSTTMAPTISRIKSHRIGLLNKRCSLSDLTARVFLYYFIDHKKQLAGFTYRIGKPLQYDDT